ncbi:hypothetical protein MAR_023883 [Mya arenaria]|uniref:EGF-like domain-containing protein n=1 Tax=Mya arenaria TaxID=6604 RepID=A0ABY7DS55_MYAAR|nr:hypothetical protein MAR_023883 [Mya arenaria]
MTSILIILHVLIGCGFISLIEGRCMPVDGEHRYGEDCSLTCHCVNGAPCRRDSGECRAGCSPGWTGKDCQIKEEQRITNVISDNGEEGEATEDSIADDGEEASEVEEPSLALDVPLMAGIASTVFVVLIIICVAVKHCNSRSYIPRMPMNAWDESDTCSEPISNDVSDTSDVRLSTILEPTGYKLQDNNFNQQSMNRRSSLVNRMPFETIGQSSMQEPNGSARYGSESRRVRDARQTPYFDNRSGTEVAMDRSEPTYFRDEYGQSIKTRPYSIAVPQGFDLFQRHEVPSRRSERGEYRPLSYTQDVSNYRTLKPLESLHISNPGPVNKYGNSDDIGRKKYPAPSQQEYRLEDGAYCTPNFANNKQPLKPPQNGHDSHEPRLIFNQVHFDDNVDAISLHSHNPNLPTYYGSQENLFGKRENPSTIQANRNGRSRLNGKQISASPSPQRKQKVLARDMYKHNHYRPASAEPISSVSSPNTTRRVSRDMDELRMKTHELVLRKKDIQKQRMKNLKRRPRSADAYDHDMESESESFGNRDKMAQRNRRSYTKSAMKGLDTDLSYDKGRVQLDVPRRMKNALKRSENVGGYLFNGTDTVKRKRYGGDSRQSSPSPVAYRIKGDQAHSARDNFESDTNSDHDDFSSHYSTLDQGERIPSRVGFYDPHGKEFSEQNGTIIYKGQTNLDYLSDVSIPQPDERMKKYTRPYANSGNHGATRM